MARAVVKMPALKTFDYMSRRNLIFYDHLEREHIHDAGGPVAPIWSCRSWKIRLEIMKRREAKEPSLCT